MIRQLSTRCWYVNGDWEEVGPPHFATQAEARACATEIANPEEPPPALRRPGAACWITHCARCERPLGDAEECCYQLHCASRAELGAALDVAGWRQADGRWCCPGCAAARPALGDVTRVLVTIRLTGGASYEVAGEATACPQLAVIPLRGDPPEERWLGVVLTHRPTGRHLPTSVWTDDVGTLHRVAQLLTHLDWTSPDPSHYTPGYARPLLDAVNRATAEHDRAAGGEPR